MTVFGAYGINYSYGGGPVLNDVSLELERGRIVALLGPNGCGKSTFLKIMAGILPLKGKGASGVVRFAGDSFFDLPAGVRATKVAYVAPDFHTEFPMTAREVVSLGRIQHSGFGAKHRQETEDLVQRAMELCHCWGLRERDAHTLSGGEKQLVAVARAIVQGARILLLDETLSRMDLHHQAAIGRLLRKLAGEGYSIVLVSHDVNLATEWADDCLLMRKGVSIAFGPTREVLTIERVRTLYPSSDLVLGASPTTGAPKVFFA